MFENGVSSNQNLDFLPAAQISTILSKIQAGGSPKFMLLAGLFPLISINVSQNLSNNLLVY